MHKMTCRDHDDNQPKVNEPSEFEPLSFTGPQIRVTEFFFYFSSKTYVVGTQKNRLNERVLLSTQNTCLN